MGLRQRLAAGVHIFNMGGVGFAIYLAIHNYDYPFIKENCRTAANWSLTLFIYCFIGVAIVVNTSNPTIESSATIVVFGLHLIFCIIAAKKALNNQTWQYPLSIKFF